MSQHPITAAASPSTASGRDARGRFVAGHSFGPDNPTGRRQAIMRAAFLDTVTSADVQAVMAVLKRKSAEGNLEAMKLFLQYAVGKQRPANNLDSVVVEEREVEQATLMPASRVIAGM